MKSNAGWKRNTKRTIVSRSLECYTDLRLTVHWSISYQSTDSHLICQRERRHCLCRCPWIRCSLLLYEAFLRSFRESVGMGRQNLYYCVAHNFRCNLIFGIRGPKATRCNFDFGVRKISSSAAAAAAQIKKFLFWAACRWREQHCCCRQQQAAHRRTLERLPRVLQQQALQLLLVSLVSCCSRYRFCRGCRRQSGRIRSQSCLVSVIRMSVLRLQIQSSANQQMRRFPPVCERTVASLLGGLLGARAPPKFG